jgi:hypothetical protein
MSNPARPDDHAFCDGIGFDNPGWPGPWGCGTVMWEVVDGAIRSHLCALGYDHVEYRDEPHVCTQGHSWGVCRPRRRWWEWLLRRPVEELPWRREPGPGAFWADLNRHMQDPRFRRSYVKESLRIQAFDDQMNAGPVDGAQGPVQPLSDTGRSSAPSGAP